MLKKILFSVVLVALLAVITHDAWLHFDKSRIQLKRNHRSGQKHWSLFYDQQYVYNDSSFKYENDFSSIERLIEPDSVVLSGLATSYYLAASLPVFVRNVHRHHMRFGSRDWFDFLQNRSHCYLEKSENRLKLFELAQQDNHFRYVVFNNDKQNRNLRYDCFPQRSEILQHELLKMAELLYQGEYLSLYEIKGM